MLLLFKTSHELGGELVTLTCAKVTVGVIGHEQGCSETSANISVSEDERRRPDNGFDMTGSVAATGAESEPERLLPVAGHESRAARVLGILSGAGMRYLTRRSLGLVSWQFLDMAGHRWLSYAKTLMKLGAICRFHEWGFPQIPPRLRHFFDSMSTSSLL